MKILFAAGDREYTNAQVDMVADHSWPAGTEVKVLHVLSPIRIGPGRLAYWKETLDRILSERQEAGKALVSEAADKLRAALGDKATVEEEITHGEPKDEILKTAQEWGADLIVLGSHGRRGVERFLLGSVSSGVSWHAPCSVLIVRLPREQKGRDFHPSGLG